MYMKRNHLISAYNTPYLHRFIISHSFEGILVANYDGLLGLVGSFGRPAIRLASVLGMSH
jgi:hypothetical protein